MAEEELYRRFPRAAVREWRQERDELGLGVLTMVPRYCTEGQGFARVEGGYQCLGTNAFCGIRERCRYHFVPDQAVFYENEEHDDREYVGQVRDLNGITLVTAIGIAAWAWWKRPQDR